MKKHILTLVCLFGTVSSVFGSACEDDREQREKRTREEMTLVEYVPPLINYTLDDIDAILFGAPADQGENAHKKQCTALPSPRLLTFHDACEKVDPQYKDCVQKVMPVLCVPRDRYQPPYSSDTIPSLEKMCRIVLIKTATCHARLNNMAPIAYLRTVADQNILIERALFSEPYTPLTSSKLPLFEYFSSVIARSWHNKLLNKRFHIMASSPYLRSLFLEGFDSPELYNYRGLSPFVPNLETLISEDFDSPELYNNSGLSPFFPNLETLILEDYSSDQLAFLVFFQQLRHLHLINLNIHEDYAQHIDFFLSLSQLQSLKLSGEFDYEQDEDDELSEEDYVLQEGLVDVLCRFKGLTKLSVRKDRAWDLSCIPNYVQKLTSLEHLTFSGDLGLSRIGALCALKNLRTLNLDETSVTSLAPLRHLPKLHFVSARRTKVVPDSVKDLTQLRYLNLSNTTSDHKWQVASLQHLARLTNLRALDLRKTVDGHGVWRRKDTFTVAKLGLVYFAMTTKHLSAETLRLFKDVGLYYTDENIDPILKRTLKHPDEGSLAPNSVHEAKNRQGRH